MNEKIENELVKLSKNLGVSVDSLKAEMENISVPPNVPDAEMWKYNGVVRLYRKQLTGGGEVVNIINLGFTGLTDWSAIKRRKALVEVEKIGREEAIVQKIIDENGNVLEKYTEDHRRKISAYPGLLSQEGKPIKDFDINLRYAVYIKKDNQLTPGILEIAVNVPKNVKLSEDKMIEEGDILFSEYRTTLLKEYSLPNFTELSLKCKVNDNTLKLSKKPQYEVVKTYTYQEALNLVTTPLDGLDAWNEQNAENFNAFFITNGIAQTVDITSNGSYIINFSEDGAPLFDDENRLTEPITGFMDDVDFMEGAPVIIVGKTNYKQRDDSTTQKNIRIYSILTEDTYRVKE